MYYNGFMQENQNLQSEIDMLINQNQESSPETPAPTAQTAPTPVASPQPPQQVNMMQPQQTQGQEMSPETDSVDMDTVDRSKQLANSNSLKYILIGLGTVTLFGIVAAYFFRSSILGPLNFNDCVELETSRVIELEPAYCVTQEGEIFYKNRNEALPESSDYTDTFDPNNPPETILPEL